ILYGMDTSEPPDGAMNAHNNTRGGTLGLPCPWNDEDELGISGSGDIAPGQTSDVTLCLVADLYNNPYDYPKYVYARVYARQAQLKVWVTGEPVTLSDGRVISSGIDSVAPVSIHWTGFTGVEYKLCGADAVAIAGHINSWQDLTFWPQIPGSGGYGQIVNYTLHVQNLGKTTAHGVSGYFQIGWDDYDGTGPFPAPTIQNFSQDSRIDCPPRPFP